jgi:hypothetical protein
MLFDAPAVRARAVAAPARTTTVAAVRIRFSKVEPSSRWRYDEGLFRGRDDSNPD